MYYSPQHYNFYWLEHWQLHPKTSNFYLSPFFIQSSSALQYPTNMYIHYLFAYATVELLLLFSEKRIIQKRPNNQEIFLLLIYAEDLFWNLLSVLVFLNFSFIWFKFILYKGGYQWGSYYSWNGNYIFLNLLFKFFNFIFIDFFKLEHRLLNSYLEISH